MSFSHVKYQLKNDWITKPDANSSHLPEWEAAASDTAAIVAEMNVLLDVINEDNAEVERLEGELRKFAKIICHQQEVLSMYWRIVSLQHGHNAKGEVEYSARVLLVKGGDVSQVFYAETPLGCVAKCDAWLKGGEQ